MASVTVKKRRMTRKDGKAKGTARKKTVKVVKR